MALKSAQPDGDKVDIEEVLDYIDKTLDRTKVLYEQYFLGMQKQPPAQLHTDVERRLRELQQLNIRNTGLRYRFATLQQKFGSYNSYWRRTVRQIENGTYIRNLAKISRNAALTGEEVPEEILAAMPKRMREQVKRDREQALAIKKRRAEEAAVDIDMGDFDDAAVINSAPPKITTPPPMKNTHTLGADDGDFDIEAFFASVTDEKPSTKPSAAPIFEEPKDEDTQPNAQIPTPARTMPIARVAAAAAMPPKPTSRGVPQAIEQEPSTGVHAQRAPRPVEDEPTGVVTPAVRALPGLPTKQSAIPGVTNLAPPRGTATPVPGVPIVRAPSAPGSPRAPSVPGTPSRAASVPGTPSRAPSVPGTPPRAATTPGDVPLAHQETQAMPSIAASQAMPTVPDQTQPMRPQTSQAMPTVPDQTQPMRPQTSQPIARPATNPNTSQPIARPATNPNTSQPSPRPPTSPEQAKTTAVPVVPPPRPGTPVVPRPASQPGTPPKPAIPAPPVRTQAMPVVPMPAVPMPPKPGATNAPSQQSRPNPIAPGSASGRQAIPVQSMQGPFEPTPVAPKPKVPTPAPRPETPAQRPPPGMNDADVNALYAKYVKAKEMVGEEAGPGAYSKLMKTINAQAPKIMEQYKAKGVEFSVVVKDNQVIIKAKPKT